VDVDREFQRKTNALVQQHISTLGIDNSSETVLINSETIALIKAGKGSSRMKVLNLVKSIEREAKNNSDDPYLIAMAERARMVQNNFEERQTTTSEALDQLLDELAANQDRLKRQAEQGFDALTSFVYQSLLDAHIPNPEAVSTQIRTAFSAHPNWQSSEAALRELRQEITFALVAACEQLDQVTPWWRPSSPP